MRKLLIISLLLIIFIFNSKAEGELGYTQSIRGRIIDKDSEMALIGATIILLGTNPPIGTVSDNNGEFTLESVPIGRQGIKVSYIGYNSAVLKNILLEPGKQLVLNISLIEQVITTEEVVVKAFTRKDKAINKMASISARSFTVEETERFAGSLGDPSRMVSNYAGVSMINDSRNDIVIRGNSPVGLLWRLDGVEIPNPNHFGAAGTTGGPVSMLNNNLLTNSDFFTSAFPAEYGNALSGVFDLKMRNGNNQKNEYLGQIGFNGYELGAEGPFVKGKQASYLANFRYSTLEIFNMMGIDMGTGTAIPQYKDLTFKLNFPRTKLGNFSIIGLGGLSYIELHDSEVAEMNDSDDQNYNYGGIDLDYGSDMGIIGFSHLYFINEKTRIETKISAQGFRGTTYIDSLDFDSSGSIIQNSNYKFYESEMSEIKYTIASHIKKKFNSKNNAQAGIYLDMYKINYIDSVRDNESNRFFNQYDISGNISLLRGYLQWQHHFNDKLTLNNGIYSHFVDINKELTIEPRLGLKYNLTNLQTVSFGYGLHSQMQPRYYYYLQTELDDGSYITTNKNVKMSKAHQLVVGYDKLFAENIRFKTEVYYQSLFDVPINISIPQYSVLNSGDDFYNPLMDSLINQGIGKNYGIELTLEKFMSKGYYFLSTLSLYQSKYIGYDDVERNTAFNNNYVFNILGGYEFSVGNHNLITLDLKSVYAGGKPYTPIDVAASLEENYTEFEWENAFAEKFDNYFRLDLRIGFKLNSKRLNQEWALDLQNLTNHKNIYKQSFNPRTQDISYDYQTGFFPMMLYRIRF